MNPDIASLEHDINLLNRRYRVLVEKSKSELSDLTVIRKDMSGVLNSIEQKSEWLLQLKRTQQEFLKSQLHI